MRSLDLWNIEESGSIANQQTAGESLFWYRLDSTLGYSTCPVRNAFAPRKDRSDTRVIFEALEFLERVEVWIFVIESDDKADRDLVVRNMI